MSIPQGYKQTEIGVIPEDWEVKQLKDFADFIGGGTPAKENDEYWNGDIPWISSSDKVSFLQISLLSESRNKTVTISWFVLSSNFCVKLIFIIFAPC